MRLCELLKRLNFTKSSEKSHTLVNEWDFLNHMGVKLY